MIMHEKLKNIIGKADQFTTFNCLKHIGKIFYIQHKENTPESGPGTTERPPSLG